MNQRLDVGLEKPLEPSRNHLGVGIVTPINPDAPQGKFFESLEGHSQQRCVGCEGQKLFGAIFPRSGPEPRPRSSGHDHCVEHGIILAVPAGEQESGGPGKRENTAKSTASWNERQGPGRSVTLQPNAAQRGVKHCWRSRLCNEGKGEGGENGNRFFNL